MSSEDLQKALLGWSGGFSAIGGVGGNIFLVSMEVLQVSKLV